jgi:hypothetical protein
MGKRQTVLQRVKRGELQAVLVRQSHFPAVLAISSECGRPAVNQKAEKVRSEFVWLRKLWKFEATLRRATSS